MTSSDLTAWLRARSDDDLAELFRRRPDLVTPVPPDLAVVGSRAGLRMSVSAACERLDQFRLEVLQAVVVLGPPVATDDLVRATGLAAGIVIKAVDDLCGLALLYGEPDALQVAAAVPEVVGPTLLGLGRPVRECLRGYVLTRLRQLARDLGLPADGTPAELQEAVAVALSEPAPVLARAGAEEKAVLARLASSGPVGHVDDATRAVTEASADGPVRWLIAVGLLAVTGPDTVELPREVGLAVRGGLGALHPEAPEAGGTPVDQRQTDSRGAGQAAEAVRLAEAVVEALAAEPPRSLRSGGIGVRDLRRLAREVGADDATTSLLLEVLHAARLLDLSASAEPVWLPTPEYDLWLASPTATRWATLAEAWVRLGRLPSLAGERDDRDKVLAPLSPDLEGPTAARARRQVLQALPDGAAVDPDLLLERLRWRAPRLVGRLTGTMVSWSLTEGSALGVVVGAALTGAGRLLLAGDRDGAAAVLRKALPAPVDHVLLQPDLSVVAPGPLTPSLREEMALVADVESAGAATVYRLTEASLRRALDHGRTATDLMEFFTAASRTPVPQSLEYLVGDLARRHGLLRAGAAGSYLRCDDDTLLQQVLVTKGLEDLGARRLAPGVLVAEVGQEALLDRLRRAGFAPVAEGSDGSAVLTRQAGRRTPARRRPAMVRTSSTVEPERLVEVVAALRSGDTAATRRDRRPVVSHTEVMASLAEAIRDSREVQVDYVDSDGRGVSRTVAPQRMEGGYVTALDHRSESRLSLALHRITAVHSVV